MESPLQKALFEAVEDCVQCTGPSAQCIFFMADTFAAVTIVIAIVGIGACLLPALQAAKIDPAIALRCE
jgi:ABC-type antimicrobial peptide transport system permease subunit